jgi:hypothetical protein
MDSENDTLAWFGELARYREVDMAAHLRVYPESVEDSYSTVQEPSVRVSLGDLLPLITLAKRHNYLWLQDFLEDEVVVTPDLYEILRSFQSGRRA